MAKDFSLTPPPASPGDSKKLRPRDEHWDAVVSVFGYDAPLNESERSRINKAIRLWREAGGLPEEWKPYAGYFRRIWPNATATPLAIANNRSTLKAEAKRAGLIPRSQTPQAVQPTAPLPSRSNPEMRVHTQELLARLKR